MTVFYDRTVNKTVSNVILGFKVFKPPYLLSKPLFHSILECQQINIVICYITTEKKDLNEQMKLQRT